jgi:hypothetical protein
MKRRNWGATGATDWPSWSLHEDTKQAVQAELRKRQLEVDADFFNALVAIGRSYTASEAIANESKPSKVRSNLKHAQVVLDRSMHDIAGAINALDGNSKQILRELDRMDGGFYAALRQMFDGACAAENQLKAALDEASLYPQKGNLPKHHLLNFACNVGDALEHFLKRKPTSTKEGLFEAISLVLLNQLTVETARAKKKKEKEKTDIHDLIRRAVFERKTNTERRNFMESLSKVD